MQSEYNSNISYMGLKDNYINDHKTEKNFEQNGLFSKNNNNLNSSKR